MTLAICCYYFYTNYHIQQAELLQNASTNIDFFQSNINKMLMRCESFSDKIFYDNNIAKVLVRKYEPKKSYYNIDRDLVEAIGDISLYLDNDIVAKYIRGILIKGKNGEVIKYGEDADYIDIERLEEMRWFQENKNNSYVEWAPMIENESKVSKIKYQLPIARQIISSYTYRYIGWQYISISPTIIRDAVADYELSNNDILLIFDSKSNCVYSNRAELFGSNFTNDIKDWGDNKTVAYDGQKWFMVKNYSEYSGLTIVQLMDYKIFQDQINILVKSTSLVILVSLIVIFLMISLLSNNLTKPISRITKKMTLISQGDFSVDESLEGDDEIGTLGREINKLAQSVDSLMIQIREEEARKKELEYKTLQSQINPHFVYNVLNSVRIMAQLQGADSICTMVENFGELLKEVSKGVDDKITIAKEFELTERYVYLQKIRKKGMIRTEYEIESGCEDCLIIKFLLQPLVENAILHGFEGKRGMEFIYISAVKKGEDLLISIKDNGKGMGEEEITKLLQDDVEVKTQYNKVGVKNIQERIQLLYGPQYGLSYESKLNEYTIVRVLLPFEVERGEKGV